MNSDNKKIKCVFTFFFILPILNYVIFTGIYKFFDVYIYLINNKHPVNQNPVQSRQIPRLPNTCQIPHKAITHERIIFLIITVYPII